MQSAAVIKHISQWLNDYCESAGMAGFVVGVSGGIDSALTSTLCAMTGKKVIAVSMPIYQKPDQVSLAEEHLAWLDARFDNVTVHSTELTPVFSAMEEHFPAEIQDPLSMANSRARLRMLLLYTYAGHHKMLVGGTGNKVEDFGVGFFTKYGDGGVDISPIADLMKTEVYALAAELGVSKGIQAAAPTDGLWEDDRNDESQLGASYAELEWAMRFEESDDSDDGLSERQLEVLATYRRFHRANLHKMVEIPVCKIPESLK